MTSDEEVTDLTTRERLVLANAAFLFARYGAANVTLAEIAEGRKHDGDQPPADGGQVSLGAVRTLFRRKEDILRRIFDIWWDRILAMIGSEIDSGSSAGQTFRSILSSIPRLLEEDLSAVAVLIRERYPAVEGSGARECLRSLRCLKVLTGLIEKVYDDGQLALPREYAQTIVHCFYGAIEHGLLNAYVCFNSPADSDQTTRVVEARRMLAADALVGHLVETLHAMANGVIKSVTG